MNIDSFNKQQALKSFWEEHLQGKLTNIPNGSKEYTVNLPESINFISSFATDTDNLQDVSERNRSANVTSRESFFNTENQSSVSGIANNNYVDFQDNNFQHIHGCKCSFCCSSSARSQSDTAQREQSNDEPNFFSASGRKWPQPQGKGSSVNITYSFSNLLNGGLQGISTKDVKAGMEEAFRLWSKVAPLNFTEVKNSSSAAQIRIGHQFIDGQSNTLAFAYFPTNGDITFDNGERWSAGLFLETAVHEIGHSLGLNHENTNNAIMNPSIKNRYRGLGSGFLLQDDINGIRNIYGNGRGSVDPLGGNSNPPANPQPQPNPQPGSTKIKGTSGDDRLVGNGKSNIISGFGKNDYLEGRGGNDTLKGGGGNDTFAFKSLDGSVDTITDFTKGDRVQVSRSGFGSGSGFAYNSNTGALTFQNQQFAILTNKPSFADLRAGFTAIA